MVREAVKEDLDELLNLYLFLHEKNIPKKSEYLENTWKTIIEDINHHIVVKEINVIIPNLTRNIRPYALIENIVTNEEYCGKGYATECLNYAKEIAIKNNCYKMMLLTGTKNENTVAFYKSAGYNSDDKIAFIQWL